MTKEKKIRIYKATKRPDSFMFANPMPDNKYHNKMITLEQGMNEVTEEGFKALQAHPFWKQACKANGIYCEGEPGFEVFAGKNKQAVARKEAEDASEPSDENDVENKSERQLVIDELKALNVEFDEDAGLGKLKKLLEKNKK